MEFVLKIPFDNKLSLDSWLESLLSFYKQIIAWYNSWCHMAKQLCVNIGSHNGLLLPHLPGVNELNPCGLFCLTHWGPMKHIFLFTMSSLFQVMAWHLFGAEPLLEPMMTYLLNTEEQITMEFVLNTKHFCKEIVFENVVCKDSTILLRPQGLCK